MLTPILSLNYRLDVAKIFGIYVELNIKYIELQYKSWLSYLIVLIPFIAL